MIIIYTISSGFCVYNITFVCLLVSIGSRPVRGQTKHQCNRLDVVNVIATFLRQSVKALVGKKSKHCFSLQKTSKFY